MSNNGEIKSSTKEVGDKCLAICGDILWCQVFKMSIFSIIVVRYLQIFIWYGVRKILFCRKKHFKVMQVQLVVQRIPVIWLWPLNVWLLNLGYCMMYNNCYGRQMNWRKERQKERKNVRMKFVFSNTTVLKVKYHPTKERHLLCTHYILMHQIINFKTVETLDLQAYFKISRSFKSISKWISVSVTLCETNAYSFLHNWIMIIELQNIFMNSIQNQVTITTAY